MKRSRGHVPVLDWPGALGILFLLGALAMMLGRCRPIIPPAPPDAGVDAAPIEPTKPGDCERACANLRKLACPWAVSTPGQDGVPGTADDGTCEAVCANAEELSENSLNPACVATAPSCAAAEACSTR